ncbi:MAG TPA: hypothetical protein VNT30_11245 [Stellaceae bacterium]|nr:hypothetical protein [Stellaceae bacterium]
MADLEAIKGRVVEATKSSASKVNVAGITLEADRDDDGTNFLRVIVQLGPSKETTDADLEALLETIEGAVGAVDERYPSVRFVDAA